MKLTLRAARINRGLSQQEVAKLIGITNVTLSHWENCKSYPPIQKFRRLCSLYGCDEQDIVF